MTRLCAIVVGLLGVALSSACSSGCISLFAPRAQTIDSPIVEKLRDTSGTTDDFDHSTFADLLEAHVDYDAARVDYAGLKQDEATLDTYREQIADADLEQLSRDAKLALLINAYNAFTLELVLEHYPGIETIKDIDSPWKTTRWNIGGHQLSLDDIEHGLIRPLFKDSRIHFAVNCASVGCPPLAPWPYTGDRIDEQLDQAARRTLQDERYARVDGERLLLTSLMNWYRRDFVGNDFSPRADTLPEYAARYGSKEVRELVAAKEGAPAVGFIDYDWALNDVR